MPSSKSGVVFILGASEDDDYMDNPNYSLKYYKILQEKKLTFFDKFINLIEYLINF